jgi:hypothetical protein
MIILDLNGDYWKNEQELKKMLFNTCKDGSEIILIVENNIIIETLRLDELFTKENTL